MSKGLINEILNNIADLTNLQTGEIELDLGQVTTIGCIFSSSSLLFSIPLGRILPKNTTVIKITGKMLARAGSSNAGGIFIWRKNTSSSSAEFDSSTDSILINGSNVSKTLTTNMWTEMSIQGDCCVRIRIDTGENYFFSGDSTNNNYIINQPCIFALYDLKVTLDIPTQSIYVPNATITLDAPNTTVVNNGSPIPGTIQMYAGSIAPEGFLICDGSAINRIDYSVLFNIIGLTYGAGDGVTTFNIPDLRGRVPLGVGTGTAEDATTHTLGDLNGAETHSLIENELPEILGHFAIHAQETGTEFYKKYGHATGTEYSSYRTLASQTPSSNAQSLKDPGFAFGSNQAHNNMQPYLAINYIIATGKND